MDRRGRQKHREARTCSASSTQSSADEKPAASKRPAAASASQAKAKAVKHERKDEDEEDDSPDDDEDAGDEGNADDERLPVEDVSGSVRLVSICDRVNYKVMVCATLKRKDEAQIVQVLDKDTKGLGKASKEVADMIIEKIKGPIEEIGSAPVKGAEWLGEARRKARLAKATTFESLRAGRL